jgi:hypothetical protein
MPKKSTAKRRKKAMSDETQYTEEIQQPAPEEQPAAEEKPAEEQPAPEEPKTVEDRITAIEEYLVSLKNKLEEHGIRH